MYGNEQMVILTLHLHTSIAQFGSILSWIYILASSMPIRQHLWFTVNFTMLKEQELFSSDTFISCQHKHLAIGKILFTNQKIFYTTYNLMDKKISRIRKVVKFVNPNWFIFPENQEVFRRIRKGWQLCWTLWRS